MWVHICLQLMFWITFLLIFHTQVGYGIILYVIRSLKKDNHINPQLNSNELPSVSFVIVAHNEEDVIREKILNTLSLNYPKEKLEIVVASDNSTDMTNDIVRTFANENVKLFEVPNRGGKTNAQNECIASTSGEFIALSDANAMWEPEALLLMTNQLLTSNDIGYVCGKLQYINSNDMASKAEGLYWNYDLWLRSQETKLASITAGNGSIYMIRRECYEPINPLYSHDFCLPPLMMLKGKRAVYCAEAISFEQAATNLQDESKRKKRMAGRTWAWLATNMWTVNPFKVGLMNSFFMFSHRFLRYCLPMLHTLLYLFNLFVFITERYYTESNVYLLVFSLHTVFYLLAVVGYKSQKNIFILTVPAGYCNFMFSFLLGFINFIKGDIKPYWSKAESTRSTV